MAKEKKEEITATPGMTKVGWAHFHGPVFFANKNFGEKIDVRTAKSGEGVHVTMEYDRAEKEMILRCGKYKQRVPVTNIRGYEEIETTKAIPLVQPTSNVSANPSINAQVSGPHDHVFQGLGSGQTGVGQRVK